MVTFYYGVERGMNESGCVNVGMVMVNDGFGERPGFGVLSLHRYIK